MLPRLRPEFAYTVRTLAGVNTQDLQRQTCDQSKVLRLVQKTNPLHEIFGVFFDSVLFDGFIGKVPRPVRKRKLLIGSLAHPAYHHLEA
jgi:hypothetical protein